MSSNSWCAGVLSKILDGAVDESPLEFIGSALPAAAKAGECVMGVMTICATVRSLSNSFFNLERLVLHVARQASA
jgi:hypothetical protein